MRKRIITNIIVTVIALCLCFPLVSIIASSTVFAAPEAIVDSTNPWGSGGQITLKLSGCDGYGTITVVADFGGNVTSASGWGFDSYDIDGSKVTAKVSSSGPNSWGFNGDVGIQVEGTNINTISLVSISGDGTSGAVTVGDPTAPSNSPANQPTSVPSNPDTSVAPTNSAVSGDDWLTTKGSKIVDKNGTEVWLTGVNWFGYNTGTNIFDGCWSCSLSGALKAISDRGFNLLRIPMSAELLLNWKNGNYPTANYNQSTNSELAGKNSLEIFDYVLQLCEQNGIKVMIDIHSAETDASGHNAPLWYTSKITTEQYLEALDWVSARYKDNDTVIAYDLKNEPHGAGNEQNRAIWNDSKDDNNWRYIASLAGNTILDNNPNVLIVIEGNQIFPKDINSNNFTSMNEGDYYNSWWGGNLMGVKYFPVDLGSPERNKQIVYSPHDYGPAVYQQPWFHSGFTYQSLMDEYWYDYWYYIADQGIAPILIGEWGGFMSGDNLTWMTYLRQLIGESHLNYTFWCFNANSGDTGGLVLDDFTTWDEDKYSFVKEVIWTDSNGKFVGLDHQIPLGANGVSLSEYSGKTIDLSATTDVVEPEETEVTEVTDETLVTEEVIDETTVEGTEADVSETTVAIENEDEEYPSRDRAKPTTTSLKGILMPVFIVVGSIVGVVLLFVICRVCYLLGKGMNLKEVLVNIFKIF
ncbi:MAG: glycoside hydrolase family 5 protein [Clostridia bacterium]|nr:glycoside hydrolase family 5 protein [Clostridia bacterium]